MVSTCNPIAGEVEMGIPGACWLASLDRSSGSMPVKDLISKLRWTAPETCHLKLASALYNAHACVPSDTQAHTQCTAVVCEMFPTGSHVSTPSPQLVALFGKVVELGRWNLARGSYWSLKMTLGDLYPPLLFMMSADCGCDVSSHLPAPAAMPALPL